MAEEVVTTTTEIEQTPLMVPKFIKKEVSGGKKKTAFKSDIGILIGYHPERSLKLHIPAYCWDDAKKYPECTPLAYVQAKLNQKVADLNDSDEEIEIEDFFKITDRNGDLVALDAGVTPVLKTPIVYEAIDYLMNDEHEGMNCEQSPLYKASIRVNREKFVKGDEKTVPLNLGSFFGFILFEPGHKLHIRYDWNTPNGVPYNVRVKFNPIIDCKRMQNNNGFYSSIEFKEKFYCIAFNLRTDGVWEFYTTEGVTDGRVNRYFAETKDGEGFLEALFNHPCRFFDIYSDKKYQNEIIRFIETAERIQQISIEAGEYVEDDNIFVSDASEETPKKTSKKNKKKSKKGVDDEEETMTIGEMVTGQISDNENVETPSEEPGTSESVESESEENEFK